MRFKFTRRQAVALLAGQSAVAAGLVNGPSSEKKITTAAAAEAILFPITAAETAAGFTDSTLSIQYVHGNMLRYGLVPNRTSAAAANTRIARLLFAPTVPNGPQGSFYFPNTTGADTYSFSDVIPMRGGCHLDLGGCTISNTTAVNVHATNSGQFFFLRDTVIENGTISIAQDTSLATSSGYAIQMGARGSDSPYFAVYESLLTNAAGVLTPLGNITLRNLRIKVNNTGSNMASSGCIGGLGGLQNVTLEDIVMDGNGTAAGGFQYEFGWATSGTANLRQTSHANNLVLRNITVSNLSRSVGIGVVIYGAYNFLVDGLRVHSALQVFAASPGESMFYRPWVGANTVGASRSKTLRNITGEAIATGCTLTGSYLARGGYLSAVIAALPHPADYVAQTDLSDYLVDGFALTGSSAGDAFHISAGQVSLRNGTAAGFNSGVFMTDECTRFGFENCRFTNSAQEGINLNGGGKIWPSVRPKNGSIKKCFIAGNSTSSAGAFPGIRVANTAALVIEGNRLNYDAGLDGADETTQGNAIQLSATASGVICRDNYVGKVLAGAFAYSSAHSSGHSDGNTIENPHGNITRTGAWGFGR